MRFSFVVVFAILLLFGFITPKNNVPKFKNKNFSLRLLAEYLDKLEDEGIDLDDILIDGIQRKYFKDTNLASMPCDLCKKTVETVSEKADLKEIIINTSVYLCNIYYKNHEFCVGVIHTYYDLIMKPIAEYRLTPQGICSKIKACPRTWERINVKDLAEEILSDVPPGKKQEPRDDSKTWKNREYFTIAQISDIHFDPLYKEGTDANCGGLNCCRKGTPKVPQDAAQYWGTPRACDLPLRTFEQFTHFLNEKIQPDVLVWTGDTPPHEVAEQNKTVQEESMRTVGAIFAKNINLTRTRIYPSIGNHDMFPADQYDLTGNTSQWVNDLWADIVKSFGHESIVEDVRKRGVYSIVDHKTKLRFISINNEYGDVVNFNLLGCDPTDPKGVLKWLRETLKVSELIGEKCLIFAHMPPPTGYLSSKWSMIYNAILERYKDIIVGQFYGHEHEDTFQLFPGFHKKNNVSIGYVAPSFTTYTGLNPSFRVYLMDKETKEIINFYQYRLNLTKWNQRKDGPLEWDIVYNMLDEYNMKSTQVPEWENLLDRIHTNETLRRTFGTHYKAGNPWEGLFAKDRMEWILCMINAGNFKDYAKCVSPGNKRKTWENWLLYLFLDFMDGPWRKAITVDEETTLQNQTEDLVNKLNSVTTNESSQNIVQQ